MERETQSGDGAGEINRPQVWGEWLDPDFVEAWIRWHDKLSIQHSELTRLLFEHIGLFVGAKILDVVSATGEPAFSLAAQVGPTGSVVAIDSSLPFVESVRENAEKQGFKNLEVLQADPSGLPFPDESFDIVTCRLGVMYFYPMQTSLQEIRRVLKPGGRACFLAWGMPELGTYYQTCIFPFLMRTDVVPPPPNAPTPLRFSPPGSLYSELEQAGYSDISETREIANLTWPGPPEELWRNLYEIASPLRPMFDALPKRDFDEAYEESMAMLQTKWDGKFTRTTSEIVIGSAKK